MISGVGAAIAWLLIIAAVTFILFGGRGSEPDSNDKPDDRLGLIVMERMAQFMVAARHLPGAGGSSLFRQTERQLNVGTVAQRQRFVVFAAEMVDDGTAGSFLRQLDQEIDDERKMADVFAGEAPFSLTPHEERTQQILRSLYGHAGDVGPAHDEGSFFDDSQPTDAAPVAAPAQRELSPDDRQALIDNLGWFGQLAVGRSLGQHSAEHQRAVVDAQRVFAFFMAVIVLGIAGFVLGFFGLVLLLILAAIRKLRAGFMVAPSKAGVYVETFAGWLVLFFLFQELVGVIVHGAKMDPASPAALAMLFVAMMSSLIALAWPVVRGIPWSQVRTDIGWRTPAGVSREALLGVAGYVLALPILAIGVAFTMVMIKIAEMFAPAADRFDPLQGPAHPIVFHLMGPDWLPKLLVLALGSVAAPIVEETMFRGVLQQHLRSGTNFLGWFLSATIGGLVVSFIFAAIHPQGWVAIPLLMSLAISFSLMREWRGSVLAPMVMHGVSNAVSLTLLITMLGS